jgi:hypothetical protein
LARGRLISRSLGSSRKFHDLLRVGGKLGEFCQLLYPLVVVNTDDFGRMPGDAFTIKNVVLPSSRRPERDFDRALDVMADVGLLMRYSVEGIICLQVNKFDDHQPNLHKRTSSKFPEFPGDDRNFRSNLTELKRTESKGTELNPEPRTGVRAADALFDRFWAAYPKKKSKDDAKRAWDKRRPTPELLARMLAALEQQRQSHEWRIEKGRFIPYPATWLNAARWTDEPTTLEMPVDTMVCPHGGACEREFPLSWQAKCHQRQQFDAAKVKSA